MLYSRHSTVLQQQESLLPLSTPDLALAETLGED